MLDDEGRERLLAEIRARAESGGIPPGAMTIKELAEQLNLTQPSGGPNSLLRKIVNDMKGEGKLEVFRVGNGVYYMLK
jgi:hypothetical protein